jgi:hypothetical protein
LEVREWGAENTRPLLFLHGYDVISDRPDVVTPRVARFVSAHVA